VAPDDVGRTSAGRRRAAAPETAERTAARLEAVLEAAVDGVLTIDAVGRIIAANPGA
jgi:PAS domain-containing protein